MVRLLVKKQFRELFGNLYKKADGSRRSKGAVILYAAAFVFLFLIFAGMFAAMCASVCDIFHEAGLDWAYFGLAYLVAAVIALVGSVFTTYSALYNAKDNDLLLSMPIKSSQILFARMLTVYLFLLMFELVVMLPAVVIWQVMNGFHIGVLLLSVLVAFLLSLIIFALSAGLGYVVARIASHIRNRSLAVTVLSLVLFGAYYYFCFNMSDIMMSLIANAVVIGQGMESNFNPFYHMGRGALGNVPSLLIVVAIAAVLFGLCCFLITRSFISIITTNKGTVSKKYKETAQKAGSASGALLVREFRHLIRTPMYLLNTAIASILMIVLAVLILFKAQDVLFVLLQMQGMGTDLAGYLPMAVAGLMGFLLSMNVFTATCISIEGNKNLWMLRTAPVDTLTILHVKLKAHLLISAVPALLCTLAAVFALRLPVGTAVLLILFVTALSLFFACFGLFVNLRHPRMDWTSEIVALKQSASVMITMFGGMGIVIALILPYFLFFTGVADWIYLLVITALAFGGAAALYAWIRGSGVKRFEAL